MSHLRNPGAEQAGTSAERHARELRDVNERLRELVTSLRSQQERRAQSLANPPPAPVAAPAPPAPDVAAEGRRLQELALARESLERAAAERQQLETRLAAVEAENRRMCDEYVHLQEKSTTIAQLYVALDRLHGGVARAEALAAIQEIVINVVGSEELAVFERQGDALVLALGFGVDPAPLQGLRVGEGVIGRVAASGRLYVAGRDAEPDARHGDLTACIPLQVEGRVVGVIAIWRLLGHKPGLDARDQSMFDLLSAHAGLALHLRAPPGAP